MRHRSIQAFIVSTAFWLLTGPLTALAEVEIQTAPAESGGYLFRIIAGADPVVKLVMLVLVAMSIICWAIIAYKFNEMKQWSKQSRRFADLFWRTDDLEHLIVKAAMPTNPLQTIFRVGLSEIIQEKRDSKRQARLNPERIRKQVDRATDDEIAKIERYIPFLATTGSSAPYIGLFGTVWGILSAFWEIGRAGTSSLAVVGPSIAEALIATALGLAAAIPAVMFYNFFVTKIRSFTRHVDTFSDELLDRIDREYFAGA